MFSLSDQFQGMKVVILGVPRVGIFESFHQRFEPCYLLWQFLRTL